MIDCREYDCWQIAATTINLALAITLGAVFEWCNWKAGANKAYLIRIQYPIWLGMLLNWNWLMAGYSLCLGAYGLYRMEKLKASIADEKTKIRDKKVK